MVNYHTTCSYGNQVIQVVIKSPLCASGPALKASGDPLNDVVLGPQSLELFLRNSLQSLKEVNKKKHTTVTSFDMHVREKKRRMEHCLELFFKTHTSVTK